jgi:hypothetical protein
LTWILSIPSHPISLIVVKLFSTFIEASWVSSSLNWFHRTTRQLTCELVTCDDDTDRNTDERRGAVPRKANPMVGTQLLVPADVRDRARALAIVRKESVADVWRHAIEGGGLSMLEANSRELLNQLRRALDVMGVEDVSAALEKMILRRKNLDDLFTQEGNVRARFPW